MARTTTNYGLNISEGTDLVNPLTDIFPNFETLDSDLKDVSDSAVGSATELLTGTVHALTRADSDRDIFTFTATSNFEAGETFTLDGVQVTALTPDGQTLSTGCYIIGSEVLCAVKGTLVTFYVNPSKALDSDKLDGHDSSYFATDSDLDAVAQDVSDISTKVGTGVLQTTAQDCVGAINEVNSNLPVKTSHGINWETGWTGQSSSYSVSYGEVGEVFIFYSSIAIIPADTGRNIKIGNCNHTLQRIKQMVCYDGGTGDLTTNIRAYIDTNGDIYMKVNTSGTYSIMMEVTFIN